MNREKILSFVGFGLLLAVFAMSMLNIARRSAKEGDPSLRTIRIAHWQLEDGASQAIDLVAREYERLNPGVRIIQMRIPEKVYPNWVTTQLVGGTAPDLIQIGKGIDSERTARYFRPITDEVMAPNPYNVGTPLEGLPWRETYVDGMLGGFDDQLQDYYGAPLFMATVRMYVNLALLRQVTGGTEPPRDLDALLALGEAVEAESRRTGRPLVTIAGSKYNAPIIIERLFRNATQRLALDVSINRQMVNNHEHLQLGLMEGGWGLRTPAVRAGLELASEVGSIMQPGFLQLAREDALFLFQQGRAVAIATGSWDATTLMGSSSFDVAVFDIPTPAPSHPAYGRFVLGRHSEAGARAYGPFGVTNASEHPELALDFMRFITSAPHNQTFATRSGWLPVITGVEPAPAIKAFAPVSEGYPDGFYLNLGPDTLRVLDSNLHVLFSRDKGPDAFTEAVEEPLITAAGSDLRRSLGNRIRQSARSDLVVTAEEMLQAAGGGAGSERRARQQRERQLSNEMEHAFLSGELDEQNSAN